MNWVTEPRKYVSKTLSKFPRIMFTVARGFAVDRLCSELGKSPYLGPILTRMVREAAKSTNQGGSNLDDALNRLHQMKLSDANFLQGLYDIRADVNRLEEILGPSESDNEVEKNERPNEAGVSIKSGGDIAISGDVIGRDKITQHIYYGKDALASPPLLAVKFPRYEANYPQLDNELFFSLSNIGSGVVRVPEINLCIEKWEPVTMVDYTVPAAPPVILRLKVRLSTDTATYPLLKLNSEPYRRFDANSQGAEDMCVQMSSEQNACYHIRIRIPYQDYTAEQKSELLYPAPDQAPLSVSFCYAPGWDNTITPDNLLDRKAVLANIITTFSRVASILLASTPSENETFRASLDQRLHEAGLTLGLAYVPAVLNEFIPPVTQMIKAENDFESVKVILDLAHQVLRYQSFQDIRPFPVQFGFHDQVVDSLCSLIAKPDLTKLVRTFFAEHNEQTRQELLTEIANAI